MLSSVGRLPLGRRAQLAAVCGSVCALHLHTAVRRARAGWPRLVLALPVLVVNCLTPFLFDEVGESEAATIAVFQLVWLGNFKETGGSTQLLASFFGKAVGLGIVVHLIMAGPAFPTIFKEFLYVLGMYTFLGVIMDGPATLLTSLAGLKIAPHFDQPYLSASVADFWSRRWNLTAGNALRFLIYDPINECCLVNDLQRKKPFSKVRRQAGVIASFIVSGILHEVLFWYLTGRVTGYWLAFFSLQGPIVWLESQVRTFSGQQGWKVPPSLSIALTWTVLLLTAHWLFFPPCRREGLIDRGFVNMSRQYDRVLGIPAR